MKNGDELSIRQPLKPFSGIRDQWQYQVTITRTGKNPELLCLLSDTGAILRWYLPKTYRKKYKIFLKGEGACDFVVIDSVLRN